MDRLTPMADLAALVPDLSGEVWAGIVGTLLGSLVSGAISYVLHRQSINATAKQRADDNEERRKALGYAPDLLRPEYNEETDISQISADNYRACRPRMLELNSIYADVIERIENDVDLAKNSLENLTSLLQGKLKFTIKIAPRAD